MGKYDDIVGLPHYRSKTRRPLSMDARAAQFASFAALSGHDEVLAETARVTGEKLDLSADEHARLSQALQEAMAHPDVPVIVRYFVQDALKAGGTYLTRTALVKRLEEWPAALILADNTRIPLGDIIDLEQKR